MNPPANPTPGPASETGSEPKIMTKKQLELIHIISALRQLVEVEGSQAEAAKQLGVSAQYLSDVLTHKREPGAKILNAMGWKAKTIYVPLR